MVNNTILNDVTRERKVESGCFERVQPFHGGAQIPHLTKPGMAVLLIIVGGCLAVQENDVLSKSSATTLEQSMLCVDIGIASRP